MREGPLRLCHGLRGKEEGRVGGAGGELGIGAPQLALQIMEDINLVHCRMNPGPATCIRLGLFH